MATLKMRAINVELEIDENATESLRNMVDAVFQRPATPVIEEAAAPLAIAQESESPGDTADGEPPRKVARKPRQPKSPAAVVRVPAGGHPSARARMLEWLRDNSPATIREIADGVDCSYQTAYAHVNKELGESIRAVGNGNQYELIG